MDPLKMYFLLKMGIFHCYVSLPEGTFFATSTSNLLSSFASAYSVWPLIRFLGSVGLINAAYLNMKDIFAKLLPIAGGVPLWDFYRTGGILETGFWLHTFCNCCKCSDDHWISNVFVDRTVDLDERQTNRKNNRTRKSRSSWKNKSKPADSYIDWTGPPFWRVQPPK